METQQESYLQERFQEVAPDVYRLCMPFPGCWTGVFLVRGSETYLIDTGVSAEGVDACLLPALAALGLLTDDLDGLLLTHCHGDHIGGAARLRALAPRLRVLVFEGSADKARDPLRYARKIRAAFPEYSPEASATLRGVEPDALLPDGAVLDGHLHLIHTPGHDTDAVCWLDERSGTLITGDSLQLDGTATQGCALIMDLPAYEASLKKLLDLRVERIVAGHPYLPLGAAASDAKAAEAYLRFCQERVAFYDGFVAGQMEAGVTDAPILARGLLRALGSAMPEHLFLPLHTVAEHMKKRSACLHA